MEEQDMKKIYSIKYKMFFAIFGLLILFLLFFWIVINDTYAKSLYQNEINYNVLSTDKIKSELDGIIENSQHTATILSTSSQLEPFLYKKVNKNISDNNVAAMNLFLQNISSLEPYVNSIQVIGDDGQIGATDSVINTADTLDFYTKQIRMEGSDTPFWTEKHTLVQKYPKNVSDVFSYIYPIINSQEPEDKAYIVINISYEYIEEEFVNFAIEENESAFICSPGGKIIFEYPLSTSFEPVIRQFPEILMNNDFVQDKKVFGVDNIVVCKQLNNINWKVIRVIPADLVTIETKKMNVYFKIVLLLAAGISLLFSMLLAQKFTKPIRALNDACKSVEVGNLSYHVEIRGKDEMSQLCHSFNLMIDKINVYLKRELDNQKQKTEMQFQILQAQINPHFLYNTLDSIKWLAAMQNMDNIVEMITALINLLKYNLSPHDSLTTLKDEINSVTNYVTIEKLRYLDMFELTTSLDEGTLNHKMIRFLLQPLVENSIIHGFRDAERVYRIQITSYYLDDMLHIKVIDNGCGMDIGKLQQINSGFKNDKRFNNIGVKNIQERIQLNYGSRYGLSYHSVPDSGTTAEITLPIEKDKP
ncbi:sensor histidine kinase [Caproiciproducens sp. NJN-50]|nr:sensor histidine kinase [Caproiciproducens sp. NJN-50]